MYCLYYNNQLLKNLSFKDATMGYSAISVGY